MNKHGRRIAIPLLALSVALALILAGCGGDDGEDGATTASESATTTSAPANGPDAGGKPLSQDEFVAAIVEICEKGKAESAKIDLESGADASDPEAAAAEFAEQWKKVEQVATDAFEQMRQITPPAKHADDYEEFIAGNERVLELTSGAMAAYVNDPESSMSAEDMKELEKLTTEQDRLLKKLGLPEDCFADSASE